MADAIHAGISNRLADKKMTPQQKKVKRKPR
jgi:hypothetical protein